ncbi:MAG: OmpA family protein [Devosiaceae bacterium]|nr:OmpA family protein [Devosiaceae bacterium MH13]
MADDPQEEENYWPGYVDALSTMTMVLTFVMMILVIVVFMLIQYTSRSMIDELIEQSNVGHGGGTEQMESMADTDVDATTTARNRGSPPVVTSEDDRQQETTVQSVAVEVEVEAESQEQAEVRNTGSQDAVTISQAGLVVTFQQGNSTLDDPAMEVIQDFGANSELGQSERTLEIIGYANTSAGNATDQRRLAYYRAMMIRNELLASGIPPDRIAVGVRDVTSDEEGQEVKVFGR